MRNHAEATHKQCVRAGGQQIRWCYTSWVLLWEKVAENSEECKMAAVGLPRKNLPPITLHVTLQEQKLHTRPSKLRPS
jgi:hypothetical protein